MARLSRRRSGGSWQVALILGFTLGVLSGCGGGGNKLPAVPAAGTVTLDGKPLARGTVVFHPENGNPASGEIKDGQFTLTTYEPDDGAIAGKHKVAVRAVDEAASPETNSRQTRHSVDKTKYLVPRNYGDIEMSGLEVTIPPGGDRNLKLELVSSGPKLK